MAIRFACACGKVFNVGDEHAGRHAKCAACGATNVVPGLDVEVVEELVMEAEVIEDEPEKTSPAKEKRSRAPAYDDERPRRKKKKRPPHDRDGPLARMYMEQADRDMKRDQAMARVAGVYDRDDDDPGHGWTMFGVHITAGVISGASMLLFGLFATGLIFLFNESEIVELGPRLYIAAIVCTALGAIVLVKSLFFGEED